MQALSSLSPFPFFKFSMAAHAMNWFCSHSGRIFTPQLLLSGKTVTAITKPKVHLVDILGISKSNQIVVQINHYSHCFVVVP